MKQIKCIEVVPYDSRWPEMFEAEAALIKEALGDNCIAIHHIGSTSVPGLVAKPKIDIIAVVKNGKLSVDCLEKVAFVYSGEWNIPFKYGFAKRGKIDVNLHVYEEGHSEIERNLVFRDYLRSHDDVRTAYETLKVKLAQDPLCGNKQNGNMFSGYTLGKHNFINTILVTAGFDKLRLLKCSHPTEWEAYHRIRKEQIFDPLCIAYDMNHPTLTAENYFHFVLYKGTRIVSVATVELLNAHEAALRSLATDEAYKNQGFGKELMRLIEKWVKLQGRTVLKMHASLSAEHFYRKLGYTEMVFDDPAISKDVIDLGKLL